MSRSSMMATMVATMVTGSAAAQEPVSDRLVVALQAKDAAAAQVELADLASRSALDLTLDRASVLGWWVVRVQLAAQAPTEAQLERAAARLTEAGARGVSVDRRLHAFANDPGLPAQWGLDLMHSATSWDLSTGRDVVIGVVDSGIRNHEDLQGRILPGFDFITDRFTANDGNGRDNDPTDPGDGAVCDGQQIPDTWHGTGVSGVAAAQADNGRGIAGQAPDARIVMARALGRCGGSTIDIMEAAYWLAGGTVPGVPANPNPADVLNLSLGGQGACQSFQADVLRDIERSGRIVVVAAGNEAQDTANVNPASCPGVLTVGATDHEDILASYSNLGDEVDVLAPGGDSAWYGYQEADVLTLSGPQPDAYVFTQGTSFAAPYVAGIVAQMLALEPSLNLTQVREVLTTHGVPAQCSSGRQTVTCPMPRVDAGAALQALAQGVPVPGGDTPGDAPGTQADPDSLTCGDVVSAAASQGGELPSARLTVPANAGMRLDLTWTGSADLDLYVLDAQGNEILLSSEGETGTTEAIDATTLTPGTYVVAVNAYAGSATFELAIRCAQGQEAPRFEGGLGGGLTEGGAGALASGCATTGGSPRALLTLLPLLLLFRRRR